MTPFRFPGDVSEEHWPQKPQNSSPHYNGCVVMKPYSECSLATTPRCQTKQIHDISHKDEIKFSAKHSNETFKMEACYYYLLILEIIRSIHNLKGQSLDRYFYCSWGTKMAWLPFSSDTVCSDFWKSVQKILQAGKILRILSSGATSNGDSPIS